MTSASEAPPGLQPATSAEDYQQAAESAARRAAELHHQLQRGGRLPMWLQFNDQTTDQPGIHVARLWATLPVAMATPHLLRAATAKELVALLPPGLVFLSPSPEDDPNLVGTWL